MDNSSGIGSITGISEKNALTLKWAFGMNYNTYNAVHSLCNDSRTAVFYSTAHTGIIYDYQMKKQQLLQGHCNPISCSCVSEDKKWIVTGDAGIDSIMVIWDSNTALPIKTFFSPHKNGVLSVDMSPDALFIVTLSGVSGEDSQEIALWEWTVPNDGPLYTCTINTTDVQFMVHFNPTDIKQIVSNGDQRVIFWNWYDNELKYYSPPVTSADFHQPLGSFIQTIFIPNTTQAMSGTGLGQLVVWESSEAVTYNDQIPQASDKRAVKIMKIVRGGGVNIINVHDGYIIVAGDDGCIRFYDMMMRLVAWFEDIKAGPIMSLSFANSLPVKGSDPESFMIPDFIISTKQGYIIACQGKMFDSVDPIMRKGMVIMQGQNGAVQAIACHPNKTLLATSSDSGNIQLWDYITHRLINGFKFMPPICVTAMEFSPQGEYLIIGTEDGQIRVLDGMIKEEFQEPSKFHKGSVNSITFAPDGESFATTDTNLCVGLYRFMFSPLQDEQHDYKIWIFIGENQGHTKQITGICYGKKDSHDTLYSIGEDRYLTEYDIDGGSILDGFHQLGSRRRVEQLAYPTACIWMESAESKEPLLIISNDEYKIKLWNTDSKTNRKTCLSPTYGGPITKLFKLTKENVINVLGYATSEKVIGLILLPIDGNPNKTMGLIAHPNEITDVKVSNDGKYLFTSGGNDSTVNMWSIDIQALVNSSENNNNRGSANNNNNNNKDNNKEQQTSASKNPYIALLEGGNNGEFYHEILDYFYFSQLRAQGEDTTEGRTITGQIPISEVPFLMRAIGYYPSNQEIEHMLNEIKYSDYLETNEVRKVIGINEFIRIYVNHRPVFGIGKEHIQRAFDTLGVGPGESMEWEQLKEYLTSTGEPMTEEEIQDCLTKLLGEDPMPESFTPEEFATDVLGFESYE